MLKLADYRSKAKGLPDLLPYAALVAPGVLLNKDASFLAAWEVRGQDVRCGLHGLASAFVLDGGDLIEGRLVHLNPPSETQQGRSRGFRHDGILGGLPCVVGGAVVRRWG